MHLLDFSDVLPMSELFAFERVLFRVFSWRFGGTIPWIPGSVTAGRTARQLLDFYSIRYLMVSDFLCNLAGYVEFWGGGGMLGPKRAPR